MVKRILRLITTEIRGLHEAAYLLAVFALLSQVLALVRDKLLAFNFGAGHTVDLYYSAFRIPDFVFVTVGTLVSASVLVPFLIDHMKQGEKELHKFVREIGTVFGILLIVIGVIVYFLMPKLIMYAFPGFIGESYEFLVQGSRIMLLSPVLLGLSNILGSIAQAYNRFAIFALSPVFYNVGIIFGIVILYPTYGYYGLVWGVIVGAMLHMLIQVPFVVSEKLFPLPTYIRNLKSVLKVFSLSIPRTIAISANQFMLLVLTSFATLIGKGSVAILSFAWNLQSVPLTIIGVSYASAAFPTLSRLYTEGDTQAFSKQLVISARHIVFWSITVAFLFIVLRAQIVRVVLGAGNFDWSDTRLTAAMLALFIISTTAQGLILLFTRAFYALGQTVKPLLINVGGACTILVFAYVFTKLYYACTTCSFFINSLMKVQGLVGTAVLPLALAYSCGTVLTMIALWLSLRKEVPSFTRAIIRTIYEVGSAGIIMGYVTYMALRPLSYIFPLTTVPNVFMQGLIAGFIGLCAGVLVLIALKNLEIAEIWKALHARIWKAKVVV